MVQNVLLLSIDGGGMRGLVLDHVPMDDFPASSKMCITLTQFQNDHENNVSSRNRFMIVVWCYNYHRHGSFWPWRNCRLVNHDGCGTGAPLNFHILVDVLHHSGVYIYNHCNMMLVPWHTCIRHQFLRSHHWRQVVNASILVVDWANQFKCKNS